MMEWRPIESAGQGVRVYEISRDGRVRVNGIERMPHITHNGYLRVTIDGKSTSVHRLVATCFIPNPDGKGEINHKDGDKKNNKVENLEWSTRSENMRHAYASGLHPGVSVSGEDSPNWKRNGRKHPQSMPVRAVFSDGTTKDYESQGLAAEDGFAPNKISMCITGARKRHGGAAWLPLPPPPTGEHG